MRNKIEASYYYNAYVRTKGCIKIDIRKDAWSLRYLKVPISGLGIEKIDKKD